MSDYRDTSATRAARARELQEQIASLRARIAAVDQERGQLLAAWGDVQSFVLPPAPWWLGFLKGLALGAIPSITALAVFSVITGPLFSRRPPARLHLPPNVARSEGLDPRGADHHWNWTLEREPQCEPGASISALIGRDAGEVWAAGAHGLLLKRDRSGRWESPLDSPPGDAVGDIRSSRRSLIALGKSHDGLLMVAGAGGRVMHHDGTAWRSVEVLDQDLHAILGDALERVWLAGKPGVIRLDGSFWKGRVVDLAALSSNKHTYWRCLRWPSGSCAGAVHDLWAAGPDDLWAAGDDGVLHWARGTWVSEPGAPSGAYAVWGASSDDAWVVGPRGSISHWDGHTWMPVRPHVSADLLDVWGSRTDDVWAVGRDWTVLHWDGRRWTQIKAVAPLLARNRCASWRAPDHGPALDEVPGWPTDRAYPLNAVFASQRGVWVAGEHGVIMRFDPGT